VWAYVEVPKVGSIWDEPVGIRDGDWLTPETCLCTTWVTRPNLIAVDKTVRAFLVSHIYPRLPMTYISGLCRDGLKAVLSRQRRGKAVMSLTEVSLTRTEAEIELEAEARQTKFEARPRRGNP